MESHKLHLLPGYEADLTSTLDGSLKLYPEPVVSFPWYGSGGYRCSAYPTYELSPVWSVRDYHQSFQCSGCSRSRPAHRSGRSGRSGGYQPRPDGDLRRTGVLGSVRPGPIRRTSPSSTSIFLISPFPITKRLSTTDGSAAPAHQ